MNKDEILKKARSEHRDEMAEFVRDKSIKWTYLTMVLVSAVFAYMRSVNNQPMMDLCATVCFSVFTGQLYRFIKTKDKGCLLLAVVTLVVGIFSVVRFLMGH